MNKAIVWIVAIFVGSLIMLTSASFLNAQKKADKIKDTFLGNLSDLKGSLILFDNGNLKPSWYFSAEYSDRLTGATFEIRVSMLGNVINQPPNTKKL